METTEEKLSFLSSNTLRDLTFEEVQPDAKHNWIDLTSNDFDVFLPIASKNVKFAKVEKPERAIFKLFSLGVSTSRDDWVYGETEAEIRAKTALLIAVYNSDLDRSLNRRKGT